MEYTYIKRVKGFLDLQNYGLNVLRESIATFLSCEVEFIYKPLIELKKYSIDILENHHRGFYPIDDNHVIILGRIMKEDKLLSSLGLMIIKPGIKKSARFLTILEGALTRVLSSELDNKFKNCNFLLGEDLILHSIINYLSKGGYDYRHIRHLLLYFNKLRTTSFEGNFFSTGIIITKSHFAFKKKGEGNRYGEAFDLKKNISLFKTNQINRRLWFLVDGKRSFYIGNKSLVITQLFIINHEYKNLNYIDGHTLAKSLKGGDLLFKIENEKLLSVINADNIEISYLENQWKYRDYNFIRSLFSNYFNKNEALIESLLFYIMYCSKNSISSIIWLPENLESIDEIIKKKTKNRLIKNPISILDKAFTNHILRYLSSDGVTIIDNSGCLQYFGCIVDLGMVKITGIKGTGEVAAGALATNGISIKISQDGTIKVFNNKDSKPIII